MCLPAGVAMKYTTPVMDGRQGKPSPCPTLGGLEWMASMNVYFGAANGLMAMVPAGKDENIVWPEGTTFIKCEPAPSGHWLMTTNNYNKANRSAKLSTKPTYFPRHPKLNEKSY